MPFNGSSAERFSNRGDVPQRDSHVRVIDLGVARESETEFVESKDERTESIESLASIVAARTKIISMRFESGTHKQDAALAIELIEEARYWLEDADRQKEFIRAYRDETGEDEAFSASLVKLLEAERGLKSELDHMMEVVRIWHEDDPDLLSDEDVELIEDNENLTKGTDNISQAYDDAINEQAPPSETMIASSNEQGATESSPVAAEYLPQGYHEVADIANDISSEEAVSVQPIISIEQKDVDAYLDPKAEIHQMIVIPNNLEATQEKCTALNRQIRDIETAIARKPGYMDQNLFDDALIDLSKQYAAFDERLNFLNDSEDAREKTEERQLIAHAMHQIEDIRHRIHALDLSAKTPAEKLEQNLGIKTLKKQTLENIAERLAGALERSGIKDPELYMTEQASGLGTIRRGLMKLFGKKEQTINQATLTKLRNEAIQAERNYFNSVYSKHDQIMPFYDQAVKKSLIFKLEDSNDVHELWDALHVEIEDINSQIEAPIVVEGGGEGKMNARIEEEKQKKNQSNLSRRAIEDREAVRIMKEATKPAKLRHTDELIAAIKNDPAASELTFMPEDYTDALTELRYAINTENTKQISEILPRVRSMKDEISDLFIDMNDEDGRPILEDETYINKALKILEKKKTIRTPKKKE